MEEWVLIGFPCPECEVGSIFAVRNKKNNKLYAYCEECDTLWLNPCEATKRLTSLNDEIVQKEFEWGGYATLQEVKDFGWEKYIK